MNSFRDRISPGLRGAFFYAMYWGAIGLFEPYTNVYLLRLGIRATQIGWLAAILPLCTLAIAPLVSRLADRTHRRVLFLRLACLGFGLVVTLPFYQTFWAGFHPTFWMVAAFLALFSIFRSPIVSLADSLIASMAQRHALDFGSMRLWGSFIFTLTAIGLGLVWARTGYEIMFLCAGLGFLPVVLAASMLEESDHVPTLASIDAEDIENLDGVVATSDAAASIDATASTDAAAPKTKRGGLVMEAGVLCLLGATFLAVAALFMAGNFGSVYMAQLGGSEAMIGAMMGISALGEVPGMMFGSRVANRMGHTNALLVAYLISAAGLAGYAFTQTPGLLLVFSLLRGVGFGQQLVSTVMIINTRAPHGYKSTYQGILNAACWGLAPLLGGPISGWIFQNLGPAALFGAAAGMTVAAAALIAPTYRLWSSTPVEEQALASESA